jgi:hypothetical protein
MYHLFRGSQLISLGFTLYYAFENNYTKATYFLVAALYMEILASKEER